MGILPIGANADRYARLRRQMRLALDDLSILAGDEPSEGASWQDVAGTASINLRALASLIDAIRNGDTHHQGYPLTGPVVFPSPREFFGGDDD